MTAKIRILHRSTLEVAPEAFIFDVIDLPDFPSAAGGAAGGYDPAFHNLHYVWDFGDAYHYSAPENIPEQFKRSDIAYGPRVSHTYRKPGQYRVACQITDLGTNQKETVAGLIEVSDPDEVFGGRATIFISPSGDFDAAPNGARLGKTGDLSAVLAQVAVGQERMPLRFILNRGEIYDFSGHPFGLNQKGPSLHIVASSGSRAAPMLRTTGGLSWNDHQTSQPGSTKDLVLQNLEFQGGFDSTRQTNPSEALILLGYSEKPPKMALIDRCTISGLTAAISVGITQGGHSTVINDSTITNYSYGILDAAFEAFAITGSSIRSHPQALVDATHNQGWAVRLGASPKLCIVQSSDFFSRQGWSPNGDVIATQPCIRFNCEGYAGVEINCQTSSFEGGATVLGLSGDAIAPGNCLLEKCYVVGGYQTADMVSFDLPGTTVRNNILIMPDTIGQRPAANNPFTFFGAFDPYNRQTSGGPPFLIYNNTLINILARERHYDWGESVNNMKIVALPGPMPDVYAFNNLIYQPYTASPMTEDGPLTQRRNPFFAPREQGYRTSNRDLRSSTATRNTQGLFDTYAPLAGSSALGDALQEPVPYDDFFGSMRPDYASRGALEML